MNVWRHLPRSASAIWNNRKNRQASTISGNPSIAYLQGSRATSGVRNSETVNAQTLIERGGTVRCIDGKAYVNYVLHPKTGKTHQLRVHMNSLGLPILGDDFYPNIVQRSYDDFSQPLELVARELRFDDPVTGEPRTFVSKVPLG